MKRNSGDHCSMGPNGVLDQSQVRSNLANGVVTTSGHGSVQSRPGGLDDAELVGLAAEYLYDS